MEWNNRTTYSAKRLIPQESERMEERGEREQVINRGRLECLKTLCTLERLFIDTEGKILFHKTGVRSLAHTQNCSYYWTTTTAWLLGHINISISLSLSTFHVVSSALFIHISMNGSYRYYYSKIIHNIQQNTQTHTFYIQTHELLTRPKSQHSKTETHGGVNVRRPSGQPT